MKESTKMPLKKAARKPKNERATRKLNEANRELKKRSTTWKKAGESRTKE